MNRVVALGEKAAIEGFATAAVELLPAERPAEVVAAWAGLGGDVGLLLLTPMAAAALGTRLRERPRLLCVVTPS